MEDVDKFSGRNIHPDRVMTQWVLVLMTSGERSFRIYGEDHVAHGGDFFLLPPITIYLREQARQPAVSFSALLLKLLEWECLGLMFTSQDHSVRT